MGWYYGSGINDLLVPKHQDTADRLPSLDSWSKWEISASEVVSSPKNFLVDTNPTEVEFDFDDESFDNEIGLESCLHDKDQSSSSIVCRELPEQNFQQTALYCDQPNYRLQDLSKFDPTDDNFLNSIVDTYPNLENPTSGPQCKKTSGRLQQDIVASMIVPCSLKSKGAHDVEESRAKGLSPFEQNTRDEAINEQLSLENSVLLDLEIIIAQLTQRTRICYRDALYRLARSTQQQHVDLNIQRAMQQADESVRSEDKKLLESETNIDDQAIVNFMLKKMEINVQYLPLIKAVNDSR